MAAEPTTSPVLVEGIDTRTDAEDRIDLDHWIELARRVLDGLAFGRPVEMGLRFVDPAEMADLNQQHMGQSGPTDVLSFPVDGDPRPAAASATGPTGDDRAPGEPTVLGDVIVCPAYAAVGAVERAIPLDDELALLIVHGILHLLGWDHAEPAETAAMQSEERRLLAEHHVAGS